MLTSCASARTIVSEPKTLIAPLKWDLEGRGGHTRQALSCRVGLAGALRRGVFFRAIVWPVYPESLTFQLEVDKPTGRDHTPLYRLDVRPLKPHTNGMYGADELNGARFDAGETLEHHFEDSLTTTGDLRENACEQARRITTPPTDFANALDRVCSRINIVNGRDMPPPPAQGDLF